MELNITVRVPAFAVTGMHAGRIIAEELEAAAAAATIDVQGAITPRTPVNTGKLRQGWGREVYPLGTSADTLVLGKVFNPLSYALPVETGRAAGKWPPVGPIALWVKRKLKPQAGQLSQVVFAIRRTIGTRGTRGAWMARDGWARALPQARERFRLALRRINGRLQGSRQ